MKNELRKKFIEKRNELNADYRVAASKRIFEKLETSEHFRKARKIFIYVGFGSEILTENFIKKYLNEKEIFIPKIANASMKLVKLNSWAELHPGHFGVLEINSAIFYEGEVDLVITPSIVFDKNGFRLGYGKGYYDKYFAKNKYQTSIGLSYDQLLQENVPKEAHDLPVDILLTEEKTIILNEKYNNYN